MTNTSHGILASYKCSSLLKHLHISVKDTEPRGPAMYSEGPGFRSRLRYWLG